MLRTVVFCVGKPQIINNYHLLENEVKFLIIDVHKRIIIRRSETIVRDRIVHQTINVCSTVPREFHQDPSNKDLRSRLRSPCEGENVRVLERTDPESQKTLKIQGEGVGEWTYSGVRDLSPSGPTLGRDSYKVSLDRFTKEIFPSISTILNCVVTSDHVSFTLFTIDSNNHSNGINHHSHHKCLNSGS